ncbi:hypothetical protein JKP88DRAFT_186472, partial [Tribonema minus]
MRYTLPDGRCLEVMESVHMADGLGGEVWEGARYLCKHLEQLSHEGKLQGTRVLEVGGGTGLCSLVAAALGAKLVVVTDEFPDLLLKNVASFLDMRAPDDNHCSAGELVAEGLTW